MCLTSFNVPVSRLAGMASAFWISPGTRLAPATPAVVVARRRKSRRFESVIGSSCKRCMWPQRLGSASVNAVTCGTTP